MSTARRLFLSLTPSLRLASSLVIVLLAVAPLVAGGGGHLQIRHPGQPLHPILGGITDDGGPFNRVVWGDSTVVSQWAMPAEDVKSHETPGAAPSIRFNPVSGRAIAVWVAEGDIVVSRFAVGGWSGPVVVASGAADPALAFDPQDGTVRLAYATVADGVVRLLEAPADLSSWSEAQQVSRDREYAARPVLAVDGGRLSIAYESHLRGPQSTPRDIVIAQAAVDAAPDSGPRQFTRTTLATTYFPGASSIRLDSEGPGGRLLVRWIAARGLYGWTIQSRQGAWGSVGVEAFAEPGPAGTRGGHVADGR